MVPVDLQSLPSLVTACASDHRWAACSQCYRQPTDPRLPDICQPTVSQVQLKMNMSNGNNSKYFTRVKLAWLGGTGCVQPGVLTAVNPQGGHSPVMIKFPNFSLTFPWHSKWIFTEYWPLQRQRYKNQCMLFLHIFTILQFLTLFINIYYMEYWPLRTVVI